jgi:16S rRNA (uracil1498-N3)-methyltransferase
MNLLLLRDEDFLPDGTARLRGRRLLHAREVLRASAGDVLRAGRLHGLTGTATTLRISDEELLLKVDLSEPPPARPEIDLLLAMPRPKALKKVLPAIASLGVDKVVLVNAARVEKSYFSSKVIDEAFELFCEGLEQARDTKPPELLVRERFRPFVEDEVSDVFPQKLRLLAHPVAAAGVPGREGRAVVAIGPEGGWVPFEIKLLEAQGFVPFSLGPRPLRVEVAVSYILGALGAF